jgi:hypothetical protein
MKTFDEAIRVITFEAENTPAGRAAVLAAHNAVRDRYRALTDEATNHDDLVPFIQAVSRIAQHDLVTALLTAFCNGMIVGIEMERQEVLPEPIAPPETRLQRVWREIQRLRGGAK